MWNLEFKDQLCPLGLANRVGKQEAVGAAGPGVKGSERDGRGVVARLLGPRVGGKGRG